MVDSNWLPKKRESKTKIEKDEYDTKGLLNLWNLPEPPPKVRTFKKYIDYVKAYNHFKEIYLKNVKRVWPNVPIYHEIDSFLNYLYHEHSSKPSKIYEKRKYRALTNKQRIDELKKYHQLFRKWLKTSNWESAEGRLDRIKTIRELLSPENIQKLTRSDIEKVVSYIHSMNSVPLNKVVFLRVKNNPTKKIIESWNYLLHRKDLPIEERMEKCNNDLVSFGKSAIQELISCYYPEEYPVINTNSNCGMKFFGYDISL